MLTMPDGALLGGILGTWLGSWLRFIVGFEEGMSEVTKVGLSLGPGGGVALLGDEGLFEGLSSAPGLVGGSEAELLGPKLG